jgi:hypothetical protein
LQAVSFTTIYKDLADLAKLRPLGIGFSWRRLLAASTILKHASSDFAAYLFLLPQGQLGVGVSSGLVIPAIVHLTRSAIESHSAALQATGQHHQQSPTHAHLLLDIVNKFNSVAVSRESHRFVLHCHHPHPTSAAFFYSSTCWCFIILVLTSAGTMPNTHLGFSFSKTKVPTRLPTAALFSPS